MKGEVKRGDSQVRKRMFCKEAKRKVSPQVSVCRSCPLTDPGIDCRGTRLPSTI